MHTRSRYERGHFLLTPDTFVRAPLPGMIRATAIVHAAPAHGAGFTEYTVEFDAGGSMITGAAQTFLYVLEGAVVANGETLTPGRYAYIPGNEDTEIAAPATARIVAIEKPLLDLGSSGLKFFAGDENKVRPQPMMGDEAVAIRTLMPADFAYDFAVNTMTFQPGAALPMIEMHVMEHGLLMLEGGGIYKLGENWYPVTAGDFIWMAPYCPQWFGALGKTPAKYLIYKDWNRHPLHHR